MDDILLQESLELCTIREGHLRFFQVGSWGFPCPNVVSGVELQKRGDGSSTSVLEDINTPLSSETELTAIAIYFPR